MLVVGSPEINYIGADTNATLSSQLLVEGTLRKIGTGDLTVPLHKVSSMQGSIDVLDGSLSVVADGTAYELADKPLSILDKAAFWVDANTNVVTYLSNNVTYVTQWLDVREPNQTGPWQYPRAVGKTNFTNCYPELLTDDAGVSTNLSSIHFGGVHSLRWMEWQNASSNLNGITNIRNVFLVFGAHEGYGFILGSNATYSDFHPSEYKDTGLGAPIWSAMDNTMSKVKTGRTYLNRERIDGTKVLPKQDFQLLETVSGTKEGARASNFCNDRNYKTSSTGVRIGGERLCEVILFTTRLSEAERLQIEQYLWQKWFSTEQDVPFFTAASGKSASVTVPNGVEQSVRFGGEGAFVKDGSGTLLLDVNKDTPTFNGSVRIGAGTFVPCLPTPVEVFGGTQITADPDAFNVASIVDSERIIKSGQAELVLREVPANITSISVEEGILQFAQPLKTREWPTNTAGYIPSHSFEFGAYKNYDDGTTYGGWTASINTGDIYSKVFVHSQNLSWYAPFPAPDGDYALALKADVGMETTMTPDHWT